MFISAMTIEEINEISGKPSNQFKLKDLRRVKYRLGPKVDYDQKKHSMKIYQASSIHRMVRRSAKLTQSKFAIQMYKANFYQKLKETQE